MRILVTGREGQVARSLAQRAEGRSDLQLIFAARPEVDLSVSGSIAEAIWDVRPDVIVNAAAYTAVDQAEDEPELAERVNCDAPREAALAAAEVGAGFVHLSTDYVFDGTGDRPYREEDLVQPLGVYGRTKLAGEEGVRSANPKHAILRTAWVYSPFGKNFVKSMMAAAQSRDLLTVVDDQRGSPTSALDLADAILALLQRYSASGWRDGGVTYHVAGTGETSWCGLAAAVMEDCRELGLPSAQVQPIATEDWPTRADRPHYSVLDSSSFTAAVGFAMPHWRQSVSEVVRQLAAK